jgi:hypothetical protein
MRGRARGAGRRPAGGGGGGGVGGGGERAAAESWSKYRGEKKESVKNKKDKEFGISFSGERGREKGLSQTL